MGVSARLKALVQRAGWLGTSEKWASVASKAPPVLTGSDLPHLYTWENKKLVEEEGTPRTRKLQPERRRDLSKAAQPDSDP